jgi:hypothetical protein
MTDSAELAFEPAPAAAEPPVITEVSATPAPETLQTPEATNELNPDFAVATVPSPVITPEPGLPASTLPTVIDSLPSVEPAPAPEPTLATYPTPTVVPDPLLKKPPAPATTDYPVITEVPTVPIPPTSQAADDTDEKDTDTAL